MSGVCNSEVDSDKMGREFYLDWKKDTLQVWELDKSFFVVAAMREGIKLGHGFPAVYVVEICDNFYRLAAGRVNSNDFYDGSHHRVFAHYLEKKPLLCSISDRIGANPNDYRDVSMIKLGNYEICDKLEDSINKLPIDVAKRFCKDNNLATNCYLSQ